MPSADPVRLTSASAPIEDAAFVEFAARRPDALFSSPSWLGVITKTYGFDMIRVAIGESVIPCAIVPHPRERLVAFPFCDFVEPFGAPLDGHAVASAMDELASNWRVRLRVGDMQHRPDSLVTATYHWSAVDLTGDDQWARLRPRARRKIRVANAAGIVVRRARSMVDLRAFFELHLKLRKHKFEMVPQPFGFFREIWTAFGADDRCWLLLAEHEGEVVAGTLFIQAGASLYYKFNASTADGGRIGANYLVLWEAIVRARSRGVARIDLGLSPEDQPGLMQFKLAFASVEDTILDVERRTTGPCEQERAILAELIQLATDPRCPDYLTESIGASVYTLFA